MKNQQGLKLFFILSCCTAFLVVFAQVGAFAFSSFSEDRFSEGIQISTVDLSGKTTSEAAHLVKEAIRNWEEAQTIKFIYKGNKHPLGSGIYQFFVEESLEASVPGNVMLTVEVNREQLLKSIEAAALEQSGANFNIEKISNEIISHAKVLSGESVTLDLQNYVISSTKEKTILAVSKVNLPEGTTGVEEFLGGLDVIKIPPVSQFSLNNFIEAQGQFPTDPVFLNTIASGMYEVFLKTNFEVIERHISFEVPVKERFGYDVKISQDSNLDLVVFNPNDHDYHLEFSVENGSLAIKLIGVPFTGEYEVAVKTEEFKPKTIKRYNLLLGPDETKVEQEGKNGQLVIVTRKGFDREGRLVYTELISEDFYPPVYKIEITGLKSGSKSEAGDSSSPETIMLPVQKVNEGENQSVQKNSNEGSVKPPGNNVAGEEGNKADKDNQKENVQEDSSIWGKPDEDEK